jgi:con80 domain of Katanin/WD domain, G-beta repeat
VDFHPCAEFCASAASEDRLLRVWDLRSAGGCAATYRHGGRVTKLAFSPDGRWLVSAASDGSISLWDVTAGKSLRQLAAPAPGVGVTSLQFHPHQFILASSHADRSARLWCLETFAPIMEVTTPEGSGGPRACAFSPDGVAVLLACSDGLRCCGWEPTTAYDDIAVPFHAVCNAHALGGRLLVASTQTSFVSLWVADLARLSPWAGPHADATWADSIAATSASGMPPAAMSPLIKGVAAPRSVESPFVTPTKGRPQTGPVPGGSQSPGWAKSPPGSAELRAAMGRLPASLKTEVDRAAVSTMHSTAQPEDSEHAALSAAVSEHKGVGAVLSLRLSHVTALRAAMDVGDPHACSAVLRRAVASDPVAVADALKSGTATQPGAPLMTLDGCAAIVPHLAPLMHAALDDAAMRDAHAAIALTTVEAYTRALIRERAVNGRKQAGTAVDLEAEERLARCEAASAAFAAVLPAVQALASGRGRHRVRATELVETLSTIMM